MKLIISSLTALLFTGAFLSAQMPGMVTMQQASASSGNDPWEQIPQVELLALPWAIELVMRGYVDFIYGHTDFSESLRK
jgi:hypothetical protein